ncbi:MAG TPA: DUF1800 domain-containing protein [Saprospiraceae bacterium]|nr:DUF1800 domain-containing protein [Saprospiraceae bacterium]HMQ82277.1 DUF1800 domain-containing protein [Saprospiraceae bacterium]
MEKIKHLFGRAGFGLAPAEWPTLKEQTLAAAVDELFSKVGQTASPLILPEIVSEEGVKMLSEEEKQAARKLNQERLWAVNADWVRRMASSENPLLERMTLFWHGHFACKSNTGRMAVQQLNVLRQHALGSFRELLLGIARDPSMIRYLNNQQNKKEQPNENFARELMELFTIGRGHYSENDIKEAARAFTGWSSNLQGEYVFRSRQHDDGRKTFMGKTGAFNGTDIIDILLEQKQTAAFIVRRIYRYFVNEKVDEDIVADLSRRFYESDYHIGQLMRYIFESDWFYAPANLGVKIKSPVELLAGMIRSMDMQFPQNHSILFLERALGQVLFNPPNVAGWPGSRTWIDNSTLMLRLNLAGLFFKVADIAFDLKEEPETTKLAMNQLDVSVNLASFYQLCQGKSQLEQFDLLAEVLLQKSPVFLKELAQKNQRLSGDDFIKLSVMQLCSLPEFQMC